MEACAASSDVVDFFEGCAVGLEVDVEGKALVFGVVLVCVFVAEEPAGGGEFCDFGAASTEELEDGVGGYGAVLVFALMEGEGGFVAGVNLGGSGSFGCGGLLRFDAGGGEQGE